ncbi:MAG: hypothetical protein V3T09_07730 [bacterium]
MVVKLLGLSRFINESSEKAFIVLKITVITEKLQRFMVFFRNP